VKRSISRAHLIALLTATASAGLPKTAGAQATAAKIRIGAALGDTLSEPYFGLEYGAFDQAGLSVSTTTFATGGAILQAMAADTVDVGLGDVIQITNAINAGIPFAIFAASALYSSDAPTTALVAVKDGPIRTAKDFEGKTIALNSLNSLPEISTREWLRQNGADPAATRFVEMTGTAMLESVVRGAVAGAVPGEPHLSMAKDRFLVLGKPYDMVAKSFPLTLFYARRSWLAANADAARRLTAAIYKTARWANDHHDQTALVIERVAKMEPAVVRSMTRARYATSLESPMLQPVINIAARYKAVKQPIAAADLLAS
jgi:NitT/TauT family transport system substrate-binding protein